MNRKDVEGNNIFQGAFWGLDNIGVFDRSATLPTGGHIDQSDGTSWMGMYCLNMLTIALELAKTNPVEKDYSIGADLGMVDDVRRLIAEIIAHYGRLDILVNNAGIEKHSSF